MEVRTEPREQIASWVLDNAGVGGCFLPGYKAIGAFEGETLLAAVIFDGFTAQDCNMHICVGDSRGVTRRSIRAVFDYPFRQLRLGRVSAQVMDDNEKSLEFVQRVGFVYEGAKRMPGMKLQMLFGLLKTECRWCSDPVEHKFSQMLAGAA